MKNEIYDSMLSRYDLTTSHQGGEGRTADSG